MYIKNESRGVNNETAEEFVSELVRGTEYCMMALEIVHDIGPLPMAIQDPRKEEIATLAAEIPSPPLIPPAPPLPKLLPLKKYRVLSIMKDSDSGHWSAFEGMPGCALSDDEFSEEFSSSEHSSRRGSCIPTPPPVPPVPLYLRNILVEADLISLDSYGENDVLDVDSYVFDPENPYGIRDRAEFEDVACIVCYDSSGSTYGLSGRRYCCKEHVCRNCMKSTVQAKLNEGIIHIQCPNPECDRAVKRQEILGYLSGEMKERYERMRIEAEGDGTKKTCPNCCHITEHQLPKLRKCKEADIKIKCVKCDQNWCFSCHAPWHEGLSCKEYQRGNKQFYKWTKGRSHTGVANCQKCPVCRVHIQRSTGCDQMTCNRCDTKFCYKCGSRFLEFPGLGDHYTRTSVLGCRYNYKANHPMKRRAVRGGYLGAKAAMLTGYPFLLVAGAVVVVAVGAVALPVYGGYKLYKYRKNTRKLRRRRRH